MVETYPTTKLLCSHVGVGEQLPIRVMKALNEPPRLDEEFHVDVVADDIAIVSDRTTIRQFFYRKQQIRDHGLRGQSKITKGMPDTIQRTNQHDARSPAEK